MSIETHVETPSLNGASSPIPDADEQVLSSYELSANAPFVSSSDALREGIGAAKAGNKVLARAHLLEAVRLDARNESAWLWLASISNAPEDRLSCINRVLEINPANARGAEWLEPAKRNLAQSLLMKGVAAAKAGDTGLAANLLNRSAELDAGKEVTWLWLASVAEASEDKLAYLQRVLDLNPLNEQAVKGFKQTKNRMARQLLLKGNEAAKAGLREQAREILRDVMEYDSGIEEAWLLLAYVTDTLELKETYLKRAVEINPDSAKARAALDSVQAEAAINQLTPNSELWRCAICATESRTEARDECTACGGVLSLTDVDRVLGNANVNREVLKSNIERLRALLESGEAATTDNYNLGLALLNIGELGEAIAYFRAALRRNPADDELDARIETLLERRTQRIAAQTESQLADVAAMPPPSNIAPTVSASANGFASPVSTNAASSPASSPAMPSARTNERPSINARPQPSGQTPGHARATIMVVDDSPTIRKLVAIKLEKQNYKVIQAVDGMDALAKLNEVTPDLIFLDITMPRLDGYQLCKLVRANDALKDTPVVMLSGKDGFFDKVRGRLAGSTAYVTKPFEPETLLQVIEQHVRIKGGSRK